MWSPSPLLSPSLPFLLISPSLSPSPNTIIIIIIFFFLLLYSIILCVFRISPPTARLSATPNSV